MCLNEWLLHHTLLILHPKLKQKYNYMPIKIEITNRNIWWAKNSGNIRTWVCCSFSSCSYSLTACLTFHYNLFCFLINSPFPNPSTFALWPGLCIAVSGLEVSSESLFCPAELDSLFSYFDASGQRSSKYRTTAATAWASSSSTTLSVFSHCDLSFAF